MQCIEVMLRRQPIAQFGSRDSFVYLQLIVAASPPPGASAGSDQPPERDGVSRYVVDDLATDVIKTGVTRPLINLCKANDRQEQYSRWLDQDHGTVSHTPRTIIVRMRSQSNAREQLIMLMREKYTKR